MKKILNLGILFVTLMIASCKEEPSLSFVEGSNVEALYGDTITLTLKYTPDDAYLDNITWRTSNNGIITKAQTHGTKETESASFITRGIGDAEIYAESNIDGEYFRAICKVKVGEVEMASLRIDSTECKLKLGEKTILKATYEPSNTSFPSLNWNTSDKKVATVNYKGEVEAVGIGECTITVSNERSGLKSQCQVIVSPIEMESLKLSKEQHSIEIGEKFKLTASFEPINTTYKNLYWYSSNENIATVSDGIVEAIGIGECTISVTNSDNSLTAECAVTAFLIEMTSISCQEELTMELNEKIHLKTTIQPTDATTYNNALRWHSSDENIATVNELTGEICCVGVGECTITISNIYNAVTASCHLTVIPITVKNLSLNKIDLYLPKGESEQLYCTVSPENAHNKNVTWESSNKSVAKVSEDGTVTAVGVGKATIKAIPQDGSDCSAECSVCVGTEDLIKHVGLYLAKKVSIEGSMDNNGICYFKITNNGDENLYLKKIEDRFYGSVLYDEGIYLEQGKPFEFKTFLAPMLSLFFVMYGHEVPVPVSI